MLNWPLMSNNILPTDTDKVITFLQSNPILTQSTQVAQFEKAWSEWLGVSYSVFVNSGSSANLLSIAALRVLQGGFGEIIVPSLTWVSDITSVLHNGFTPVFVDIDPQTLGMKTADVLSKLTPQTRAVFLTHVLGYNGLDQELLDILKAANIPLIEDVCESHGATFNGQKLGTFGLMSNFSFYYAHHMSTIEGGMVSTNDPELYEIIRVLRSHGMVRESTSSSLKQYYADKYPDLHPDFTFALSGYNMRSTEINAVIGLSQLTRLDSNNKQRISNLNRFLNCLDPGKYQTDFKLEGSCNYALTLVLKYPDDELRDKVIGTLNQQGVEFRRGLSGGGNQLRQPYIQDIVAWHPSQYPNVEHVHSYGFYLGNYPELETSKIINLCTILNNL